MARPAYQKSHESDSESPYSDGSDYDDFVLPVQKKGKQRMSVTNVTPSRGKYSGPSNSSLKANIACGGGINVKRESDEGHCPSNRMPVRPVVDLKSPSTTSGTSCAYNGYGNTSKGSNPPFATLNVVVCGRVDVGKSTLLGHFLSLLGAVDTRACRNGEYAWLLDQGEDERERGITIDPTKASAIIGVSLPSVSSREEINNATDQGTTEIGLKKQQSSQKSHANESPVDALVRTQMSAHLKLNFIDTPGHHDLVSNVVRGAIFASVALVIVDISDFMKEDGNGYFDQHLFLLWSLGLRHIIVCINKMDRFNNGDMYNDALSLLKDKTAIYNDAISLIPVPTSGIQGLNLVHRDFDWHTGPCLIEALQTVARDTVFNRCVIRHTKFVMGSLPGNSANMLTTFPRDDVVDSPKPQSEVVLCHIFDLWEESKAQLGCACYLETALKVPCKLVSLPSGSMVTCSQMSFASMGDTSNKGNSMSTENDEDGDIPMLLGRLSVCNSAYGYPNDFVDSMILRGQDMHALTGDRLLVDSGTFDSIKAGSGPLVQLIDLKCRVSIASSSRHKVTLGSSVDIHVGYFQVSGAVLSLRECIGNGKWKRVTSLWPGKEGILVLKLVTPLFVYPLIFNEVESSNPSRLPFINGSHTSKDVMIPRSLSYIPVLSRIMLRFHGDVVGGGIIVDECPP